MNNRGTIAVMSAIIAIPVILSLGLALDASQIWLLRQRMQWSVDSAALLGASQSNGEVASLVDHDTKELFWANYGAPNTNWASGTQIGFLGSSSTGATVTTATSSNFHVTVTASATLPTNLMSIAGIKSSTVQVSSTAAVPHNVEMMLVLDNSLSMDLPIDQAQTQNKLAAMKSAASNMVTTVFGNGAGGSVFMGIVPFVGAVNIGNSNTSFLNQTSYTSAFPVASIGDRRWRGCVLARTGGNDVTEARPAAAAFEPYLWTSTFQVASIPTKKTFYTGDNNWTNSDITDTSSALQTYNTRQNYSSPHQSELYAKGPNLACPHASLVPLTNTKTTLTTAINGLALVNGGGTIINSGLQWGWLSLSPAWAPEWNLPKTATLATRPLAYSDNTNTKVIVLMTDGVSEIDGINSYYASASDGNSTNCNNINNVYPECKQADSWYTSYGRISSKMLVDPTGYGIHTIYLRRWPRFDSLEHFWVWGMCWSFEKARLVILAMSVARLWEPG